jgi:hypothetical protein
MCLRNLINFNGVFIQSDGTTATCPATSRHFFKLSPRQLVPHVLQHRTLKIGLTTPNVT